MAAFVIRRFAGMRPIIDARLLQDMEAQVATNARLQSGALVPFKNYFFTALHTGRTGTAVKRIYPVLNNTKILSWTTEVDVFESPIIDDQWDRIYWSGDGAPKYGPKSYIAGGAAPFPTAYYTLGIPKPANKPRATGAAISDNATETREYAITYLNADASKESAIGTAAKTTCLAAHYDYGLYDVTITVAANVATVVFTYTHDFAVDDYVKAGASAYKVDSVVDAKTITFNTGGASMAGITSVSKRVLARTKLTSLPTSGNSQTAVTQKRIYRKDSSGNYRAIATIPLAQAKYDDDLLAAAVTGTQMSTAVLRTPSKPSFAPTVSLEISDQTIEDNVTSQTPAAVVQRVYAVSWVGDGGQESPLSSSSGFIRAIDGSTQVKVVHGEDPPANCSKKRIYRQNVTTQSDGTYSAPDTSYRLVVELPASQTNYVDTETAAAVGARAAPGNPNALTPPAESYSALGTLQPTRNAETRSYVYTYVSQYGEEGPPSDPSETVDIDPDYPVTVSNLSGAPTGNYNITKIHLYRTATAANGTTQYQLVTDNIALGVGSYVDKVLQSSLGEVIPSTSWVAPPVDLAGLRMMANGIAIGWSQEKTICFSEQYQPHAYPAKYRVSVDYPVVGIAVFGQSAAILTKGFPYLVGGVSPESMTLAKLPLEQACVSKRSIVETGNGVMYASPDGLVLITPGGSDVVTKTVLTQAQWQAYNPDTIHGYWHESRYHGFCTVNNVVKMFIFDPTGQTASWCETSLVGYAAHRVIQDDRLIVVDATGYVQALFAGNTNLSYTWRSKIGQLPSPGTMAFGQVVADSYPVTMKVIADGVSKTYTASSANPFRLESGFLAREWEIEISGTANVTAVAIAQSAWELKTT
jgi:hypothetical protein